MTQSESDVDGGCTEQKMPNQQLYAFGFPVGSLTDGHTAPVLHTCTQIQHMTGLRMFAKRYLQSHPLKRRIRNIHDKENDPDAKTPKARKETNRPIRPQGSQAHQQPTRWACNTAVTPNDPPPHIEEIKTRIAHTLKRHGRCLRQNCMKRSVWHAKRLRFWEV